jgi:RNA polymerase sigma factor (sigma-70 family)
MIQDPDLLLIDKVLTGETKLYSDLIDRYKRYVYTIAFKILQNRPEAEEAAQDTFIKAYNAMRNFNRQAKFSTWLYSIAFNTAVSYKRKHKQKLQSIENTIIEYQQDAEGVLERSDKKRYLAEAMDKLSESDRAALTLYYLQEFSLEEIAEITGSPSNTIKVRIHRARLRMAEELKGILKQEALSL